MTTSDGDEIVTDGGRVVPSDYDSDDGWGDNGLEQCPHCGDQLGGEAGRHEDVYDQRGRHFEYFLDTDSSRGPFFCPDCWEELDRNRKVAENDTLEAYTDGGTVGVRCDVDGCNTPVVGLNDGWEFGRGTVCQDCIDYRDRHGHWPDEEAEICIECRLDEGAVRHECDERTADILLSPGDTCEACGFEVPITDGGIEPDSGAQIACYTALPVAVALAAVAIVVGLFVAIEGGLL